MRAEFSETLRGIVENWRQLVSILSFEKQGQRVGTTICYKSAKQRARDKNWEQTFLLTSEIGCLQHFTTDAYESTHS
jgi:hypothetical protein